MFQALLLFSEVVCLSHWDCSRILPRVRARIWRRYYLWFPLLLSPAADKIETSGQPPPAARDALAITPLDSVKGRPVFIKSQP